MSHTRRHSMHKQKHNKTRHHIKKNKHTKNKRYTRRRGGEGSMVGKIGSAIIFIPKRILMGAFVGIKTGVKGVASGVGSGLRRTFIGKKQE